jgi:hypothetical protein
VRVLDSTPIRVGNERYLRENGSVGLTTMQERHVEFSPGMIHFRFRGKSGKDHVVVFSDPEAARVIRKCAEIPGEEVFKYRGEDGSHRSIDSEDLNEYIQQISGYDFTAGLPHLPGRCGRRPCRSCHADAEASGSGWRCRRRVQPPTSAICRLPAGLITSTRACWSPRARRASGAAG